ncbi:MAG TPA: glycosyltransferase, partial [Abditibacterium sp.]
EALESIGGFDELNVTEDFATSFFLHLKGWDTLYLNRVYVYSLAPENLAAYFTQQSRWSFGTLGTARSFIKAFRQNPRALRAGQWWEYFLSATYYWVGWVNFIFLCLPLTYLFFGVKPLRQDVFTYVLVFVPYMFFTLQMFYSGMERRGYKLSEMVLGQQIGFISFPIHMSSAVSGLMGKKRPFGVTPKGVGGHIAWISLWPQLLMLGLSALAFCLGVYRYATGVDRNSTAVIINSLWALYHVWMLWSVFQLNRDVREGAEKWFFTPSTEEKRAAPLPALEGAKNPLTRRRIGGTLGLASLAALGLAGYAAWQVSAWSRAPVVPVDVYVLDRTPTRDGNQHRNLLWMLNYLKIVKAPDFGPSRTARRNYDAGLDYYGAVSSAGAKPQVAPNGDLTVTSLDRALPTRLSLPGALYLADTYGETDEFDAVSGQNVRRRAARRGLSVAEIDAVETFARRGGLVMAEWNCLGFPTRPGGFIAPTLLKQAIESMRARIARLGRQTIPQAREAVAREAASGSFRRLGIARGRLEDARGALVDATYKLRGLQGALLSSQVNARQDAAATRLEKLLRVAPSGWYGRYVEDFAAEKVYNPALWQAARDDLRRRGAPPSELRGPGFVFYPGALSRVFDPQTGTLSPARVAPPIAVVGSELGADSPLQRALIEKTTAAGLADDPLLRDVADQIPARNWFEVCLPQPDARVLASYRLSVSPAALARLKKQGFPAQYLDGDGEIRFPALVVGRDQNSSQGELRSVYLAGDAAGYAAVPAAARRLPALGRLDEQLATRFGSFSARFTWDFYAPVLRQALTATPRLRKPEAH